MSKIQSRGKIAACLAASALIAGIAGSASAETHWAKNHPRRHEVNGRLANQDRRTHNEVKEGEMSNAQARQLHKEDHQIRREERAMARQNGGHLTKQEQRALNQQENTVSRQIGK